jgi:tRNA nucleotidyltransferase (CCA-adding enzyme)
VQRKALDYMGDSYPGEQPEQEVNIQTSDSTFPIEQQPTEYKFFYGNGDLHVSPMHSHEDLAGHANIQGNYTGPMAVGFATVNMGKAAWSVRSNVNAQALGRIFKDYGKQVGWKWGGMTTLEGEPIGAGSEFAPVKSYVYTYQDGHLYLSSSASRLATTSGAISVQGHVAHVSGANQDNIGGLLEWADDEGFTLVAGNDNVIKSIEDLDQFNLGNPEGGDQEDRQYFPEGEDERKPGGVYRCPNCAQIFPTWNLYIVHRRTEDAELGEPEDDGHFPEIDQEATFPAHFTEQKPEIMPVASASEARKVDGFETYAKVWNIDSPDHRHYVAYLKGVPVGFASIKGEWVDMVKTSLPGRKIGQQILSKVQSHYDELQTNAASPMGEKMLKRAGFVQLAPHLWKWSALTEPKDMIPASLPFIYDIDSDTINVGNPGQRTSDIPGRFTPGGIVEGEYEPGGKVTIRTMTNTPYTVRHMLELWYYTNPHLEVKSVSLMDDAGKATKLAAQDVGAYIKVLVAADPAATASYAALEQAGGKVFVVGGAVRDALLGKHPKDIDLMVTGLPSDQVHEALKSLPGKTNLTGKDFGVFRYREAGDDVEIALPRREKSSGGGYKDFHIQADHTMTPEEDLYRRDFTANAMAVDIDTGHLIDPYGGADDIKSGRLSTLNDTSLSEDPLRVLRAITARAKHGLKPTDDTAEQMRANAGSMTLLPQERLQMELDKIMRAHDPASAIKLAHDTGVLKYVLPEVDRAFGWNQNNPHHELELGEHLLQVLRRAKEARPNDPDFALAALMHDIGKPDSHWTECRDCGWQTNGPHDLCENCGSDNTSGHFYKLNDNIGQDHAEVGAALARQRLNALKYPADTVDRVSHLIDHHMYPSFTTQKGARKFINKVGDDHADALMDLRQSDQGGKAAYTNPGGIKQNLSVDRERELVSQVRDQVSSGDTATSLKNLAINGSDLIAAGVPQGPEMGQILRNLLEKVLDGELPNDRATLLGQVPYAS